MEKYFLAVVDPLVDLCAFLDLNHDPDRFNNDISTLRALLSLSQLVAFLMAGIQRVSESATSGEGRRVSRGIFNA